VRAFCPVQCLLHRPWWVLACLLLEVPALPAQEPASTNTPAPRREGRGRRRDVFAEYDKNGDGRVTAEELNNPAMMQWLDRDKDGVITRREASEVITEFGANRRWARPETEATSTPAPEDSKETFVPVPARDVGIGRLLKAGRWKSLTGRRVDLDTRPQGKGRVLLATSSSCPLSRKYASTLGRMESEWASRGFEFVFVAPVSSDPEPDLRAMAAAAGWKGSVIRDASGELSKRIGLRSTTEAVVVDAAGTVVYRGAVDDQYGLGYARAEAREFPLQRAMEAVAAGGRPVLAATTAPGCTLESGGPIPPHPEPTVTYHNRISRIVQTTCGECHHTGGPAPFTLETADDLISHAGMVRKQVEKGQMPPWFAVGDHSSWINDRSLPDEDRTDLLAWLAGKRPVGNPKDAPLAIPRSGEWMIGKPDVVYALPRAVEIPAGGIMPYQNIWIETGLTEDKWVTAVEIRPTAKAAVHHVLMFALPPGAKRSRSGDDGADETAGFYAAYVPGNTHQIYPEGFAKPLVAGTRLRLQIHYTPYGTATNDRMQVALRFSPVPPRHRIHVVGIANPMIQIPAGAPNHEEVASLPVPREARLLGFLPHMHVRGKAFRYELVSPDGTAKTLLDVPRYDFNWQLGYRLAQPLTVKAGSRLRATAWYDNSRGNPANPDPTKPVKWGLQTYEEMMLGYVEYYFPDEGI